VDLIVGLAHGFADFLSPSILTAYIIGMIVGLVAGFLPGLSPVSGLALAVPFGGIVATVLNADSPVVLLISVAYGTLYGRALAAINVSVGDAAASPRPLLPPSNLPTVVFGLIATLAAAIGTGILVAIVGPTSSIALGPPEIAAVYVFLLLAGAAFASNSIASALAAVVLGLLLGTIGQDIETDVPRLTLGLSDLGNGLIVLDVAIGLFAVANLLDDLARTGLEGSRQTIVPGVPGPGVLTRTAIALLAGFLPTNGSTLATTRAARRARSDSDPFDPASQQDAPAIVSAAMMSDVRLSVSLILLLIWFAPVDAVTGLLRYGLYDQAMLLRPGQDHSATWLVCATLILVHIVPLIMIAYLRFGRWRPIHLEPRFVVSLIVTWSGLAWYATDGSPAGSVVIVIMGLLGYLMIRADLDRSLMFFAFVIGPSLEENFRRSMLIARGDATTFWQRPISARLLLAGVAMLVVVRLWRYGRSRLRARQPA
jgi:putative tricarboxylic transport membrane protein